mgnify:CR=1 FL=1
MPRAKRGFKARRRRKKALKHARDGKGPVFLVADCVPVFVVAPEARAATPASVAASAECNGIPNPANSRATRIRPATSSATTAEA